MLEARNYQIHYGNLDYRQERFKVRNNAYQKPVENPVKKEKSRRKLRFLVKKEAVLFKIVFLLLFMLSIAVVAQYSAVVTANFLLVQTRESINELTEEQRVLELEIARLSSLERIEKKARTELGMREVQKENIITAANMN